MKKPMTARAFEVLPYGSKIHPVGKPDKVFTRTQTGWHTDGWWRASDEVDEMHPEGMVPLKVGGRK